VNHAGAVRKASDGRKIRAALSHVREEGPCGSMS
jgi:hypothetical protein